MTRLPVSVAAESGAALQVVDYRTHSLRSETAPGGGVVTLTFPQVADGQLWRIERITVTSTSAVPTSAVVYAGDIDATNVVDGTGAGNLDIADELSPIVLDSTLALTIQWAGVSLGAVCTARIQYQIVQRG
jgi:hypothetical protein